ncbi:RNA exonuclease [Acrasis kona]|uniref:RNA exonuclease n=1 Tax=Acrasis kona TaxID=1008807 RepID=A0AAW2ZRX5_9EUKA
MGNTVQNMTAPVELKIMTYNIRNSGMKEKKKEYEWGYRREGLIEVIKKHNPDILGMQEVLDDQMKFLIQRLGADYTPVGVPREYDPRTKKYSSEYSCIFFNNKRFEMLNNGTFWLSDTPDTPSNVPAWGAACVRICTWVLMKERTSGKIVAHFNTHWDHVSAQARLNSSTLMRTRMLDALKKLKQEGVADPLLSVSGDFNTEPNNPELLSMLKPLVDEETGIKLQLDYTKLSAKVRRGPNGTYTDFDLSENSLIDYIFVQDGYSTEKSWNVDSYEVDDQLLPGTNFVPSDHRPIVVSITNGHLTCTEQEDYVVVNNKI